MEKSCLLKVFDGEKGPYLPILSGWIAAPDYIAQLNRISIDEYWSDPKKWSISAYQILGADGLIDIFIPKNKGDFRCVDHSNYSRSNTNIDLEDAVEEIRRWPEPEHYADFLESQFESEYQNYKKNLLETQQQCGDSLLYMPAQWNAGAKINWYDTFGYENFFLLIGLYEKEARKLTEHGGVIGKHLSKLVARAISEGIYPKAVLLGEDICSQRGPMVSPEFLEKYYAPQLREGLKPLLEVGCRPVWHCDGDVRPILDMLIDCGIGGMQGFQPECGLTLEYTAAKRTKSGGKMLIFGPLSVTSELPKFTPEQVRQKVQQAAEIYLSNADLVLFTANTVNPDVPFENILAMFEAAKDIRY